MKYSLTVFLLSLLTWSFAQTKIDNVVSITFPGSPAENSVDLPTGHVQQFIYTDSVASFLVQKTSINDPKAGNSMENPTKRKEVMAKALDGILKQYDKMGSFEVEHAEIDIKGVPGYQIEALGLEDSTAIETKIFMGNNCFYSVMYTSKNPNETAKKQFFQSLKINKGNIKITVPKDPAYEFGYAVGQILAPLILVALIAGAVVFIRLHHRKK